MIGDLVCSSRLQSPYSDATNGVWLFSSLPESLMFTDCDSAAILGPVPEAWKIELFALDGKVQPYWSNFVNPSTGIRTWQDLRLPPLPPRWEGVEHPELSTHGDPLYYHLKLNASNETTEFDHRLSPNHWRHEEWSFKSSSLFRRRIGDRIS